MAHWVDYDGLLYFWQKIKTKFQWAQTGKGLSTNDYTTDQKTKLAGIQTGATKVTYDTVSGWGFKNVADGDTLTYTLTQDSTDGHVITLTPSTGDSTTITIPDNNTTYQQATTDTAGLMSATDKETLDGIAQDYIASGDIYGYLRFTGKALTTEDLEDVTGSLGDIIMTTDTGQLYVWNDAQWQSFGSVDVPTISTDGIDYMIDYG